MYKVGDLFQIGGLNFRIKQQFERRTYFLVPAENCFELGSRFGFYGLEPIFQSYKLNYDWPAKDCPETDLITLNKFIDRLNQKVLCLSIKPL